MKVRVKVLGSPEILPILEGEEIPVVFTGDTVKDLLHHLFLESEPEKKVIFLNDQGEISPKLFIIINGRAIYYSNRSGQILQEGDFIELALEPG